MTEQEQDRNVVRVEVEVPGSPEEVWEAIATGPGMETWFVPAEVEPRVGGSVVTHHGDFGDSPGTVTTWEPPHRFAYEERGWSEEDGAPPWATEIVVEARAGGTCVVRLSSGIFGSDRDWSDEIGPTADGWTRGLANLLLYMTHFAGQPVASVIVQSRVAVPQEQVRRELREALGIAGAAIGDSVRGADGAPVFSGVVEDLTDDEVVIRTELPVGGLIEFGTYAWSGPTYVVVRGYLYGEDARVAAAREQPLWEAWLAARFPAQAG